jgi:hypothetical protein
LRDHRDHDSHQMASNRWLLVRGPSCRMTTAITVSRSAQQA